MQTTGDAVLEDPQITLAVPGVRSPSVSPSDQADATVAPSITVYNPSRVAASVNVCWDLLSEDQLLTSVCESVNVLARSRSKLSFSNYTLTQPKLWWPTGLGSQPLYDSVWRLFDNQSTLLDANTHKIGIREVTSDIDRDLSGRRFWVNGNKVFIRGANWIGLDAMMRMDKGSGRSWYEDEVRMHAEMNFNMIRGE